MKYFREHNSWNLARKLRNDAHPSEEKIFQRDKKLCRRQYQKEQNNTKKNSATSDIATTRTNSSFGFKKEHLRNSLLQV